MRKQRANHQSAGSRRRGEPPDAPSAHESGLPEERLAAFVARGRELATRLNLDFDADAWEVSKLLKPCSGPAKHASRRSLHFTSVADEEGRRRPWPKSVAEVAKAVCVRLLGRLTITPLIVRCDAMNFLAGRFKERSITECTIADLDAAVAGLREHFSHQSAELRLIQLRGLASLMQRAGIVWADLAGWRPKPLAPSQKLEDAGAARLPVDGLSEAVAKSFALASQPEDILVASACTLMQFVPSRVSELLALQEGCWNECHEGGARRLLIRFAASKGSSPCAKWVPREMADIAERALRRIEEATADARAIKRWYDHHPNRLYLPPRLEHLRHQVWLEPDEASELLGLLPGYFLSSNAKVRVDLPTQAKGTPNVRFMDVERIVLGRLEEMMRLAGGRSYHPLMLLKWRSRTAHTPSECMFQPMFQKSFSRLLTPAPGVTGMFERLGIDPSGTLKGNTHCWRHSLTTAAVRGGLSFEDLGDWFARSDPSSTFTYDHSVDADFRDATTGVSQAFALSGSKATMPQPSRRTNR